MSAMAASLEPVARLVVGGFAASLLPGLVLTAAVATGVRLARCGPAARHAAWFAALLLLAAMPVAFAALSDSGAGNQGLVTQPAIPRTADQATTSRAAQTSSRFDGVIGSGYGVTVPAGRWVLAPFALLVLGAFSSVLRLMVGLRAVRRLRRGTEEASPEMRDELMRRLGRAWPSRAFDLRVSDDLRTPVTVGYAPPAVILPRALLREMDGWDAAAVVMHELAHVARRDDWAGLAQRLLAGLQFAHPAARIIGRRMNLERELACDAVVVAALGRPRDYARSLARLAELALAARLPALAAGAAPTSGHLARRIAALIDRPDRERSASSPARRASALAATGLVAAALTSAVPGIRIVSPPSSASPVHSSIPAILAEPSDDGVTAMDVRMHRVPLTVEDPEFAAERVARVHSRVSTGSVESIHPTRVAVADEPIAADELPSVAANTIPASNSQTTAVRSLSSVQMGDAVQSSDEPVRSQRRSGIVRFARRTAERIGRPSLAFTASSAMGDGPMAQSGRALADLPGVDGGGATRRTGWRGWSPFAARPGGW